MKTRISSQPLALAAAGVIVLAAVIFFLPASLFRGWLGVISFVIVPGLIYARLLAADWPVFEQIILGLLLGTVVDPFLLIALARAHVALTVNHINGFFVAVSLIGLGWLAWRRRSL